MELQSVRSAWRDYVDATALTAGLSGRELSALRENAVVAIDQATKFVSDSRYALAVRLKRILREELTVPGGRTFDRLMVSLETRLGRTVQPSTVEPFLRDRRRLRPGLTRDQFEGFLSETPASVLLKAADSLGLRGVTAERRPFDLTRMMLFGDARLPAATCDMLAHAAFLDGKISKPQALGGERSCLRAPSGLTIGGPRLLVVRYDAADHLKTRRERLARRGG